jgi:DNA-binding NarL/FixJ family response regulator
MGATIPDARDAYTCAGETRHTACMEGDRANVRSLRVLYVEDDPVLRSLLGGLLDGQSTIDLAASVESADLALACARDTSFDVALLDLALGARSLNGVELALRLRELDPTIAIVILSQHLLPRVIDSLPERERHGWSYLQKRGDLSGAELAQVIRATAEGKMMLDPAALDGHGVDTTILTNLSARQRNVLALLATGRDAIGIADDLHLAHTTVRRDISNAYKILVPESGPGDDMRITAVLEYLRITRPYDFEG